MTTSPPLPQLAFLGIGLMGTPMARRLLQAGYAVTVWNRTYAKAEALIQFGAHCVSTVEQAVRAADIVLTMLEAGPVVAEVAHEALAHMKPGALWIDMSSTRRSEAVALHVLLAAHDCKFLDAPVSGGVAGAVAGSLAIMAGGNETEFARAHGILSALGRPTLVGPAGSGQVAKCCNQLIVGATLAIVAEALLLAQAAGADPVAVRTAIRGGFAESPILAIHGQRMLERNFVPGGKVRSQLKDLENVLAAAADAGLSLPLAALVTEHYRALLPTHPNADHSAALLALERINPGQRLGSGPDQLAEPEPEPEPDSGRLRSASRTQ